MSVKHKLPTLFNQIIANDKRIDKITSLKVIPLNIATKFIALKKGYIRDAERYIKQQRG